MVLSSLTLKNFRSYEKKTFSFSGQTSLLVGHNTAGKTNVLEAIMLFATGKSFRAGREREMIRWGEELSGVSANLSDGEDRQKLEVMLTGGEVNGQSAPLKKYLVNGVSRRQIDFVGNLHAVLFWPEDLELVTDSPSLRRRYLDSVLVQVDREYRRSLYSYERGLRQRNRLLDHIHEGTAHRHQLVFWDQLLIRTGNFITDKRSQYLEFVNAYSVSGISYRVTYDKSVISQTRLAQYKEEEVAAKATLVGPHRDDFGLEKEIPDTGNQNTSDHALYVPLSSYGSRGEQRLAVLWLKLAELAFMHSQTGMRPMLLLDDIFSELDQEHRELVLKILGNQQTILTSSERAIIKLLPANAQVIQL